MQLAALLSNSIFAAFFINFHLLYTSEATACNVHWIRYMYMRSCGRKKRDSILIGSEAATTAAIHYLKHPFTNEDFVLLNDIVDENERFFRREAVKYGRPHPKALHWRRWKKMKGKTHEESTFLNKLFRKYRFGIRGFPEQWNVNELLEQKTNKNYRRQIDRLMEQCCKTNQENTCSEDTFRGAC